MIRQGHGGKIINMASQAGRRGEALVAVYCATKAAVISLTQSAGLNLIPHRINVNAIAPGVVDGEHWDGVDALFARYENRPLGEKKNWRDRKCRTGAWARRMTLSAWRSSWHRPKAITSWRKPITSMAATG